MLIKHCLLLQYLPFRWLIKLVDHTSEKLLSNSSVWMCSAFIWKLYNLITTETSLWSVNIRVIFNHPFMHGAIMLLFSQVNAAWSFNYICNLIQTKIVTHMLHTSWVWRILNWFEEYCKYHTWFGWWWHQVESIRTKSMSNLQSYNHFQLDFQNVDQNTWGKWINIQEASMYWVCIYFRVIHSLYTRPFKAISLSFEPHIV